MAAADISQYLYPLDITGAAATNLVVGEKQTLNPPPLPEDNDGEINFHFVIPFATPYFRDTVKLRHIASGRMLQRGTDWAPGHKFVKASAELESIKGGVYASILFYDPRLAGQIEFVEYQTLGGTWTLDRNRILELMSNRIIDPRSVSYEVIANKPEVFPPIDHNHPIIDTIGYSELVNSNYDISAAIRERTEDWLQNPPILMDEYYTKDQVDAMLEAKPYEKVAELGNAVGVFSVDCLAADVFRVTKTGPITWQFTNRPFAPDATRVIEIRLRNGGNFTADTWPAGTVFSDGDKTLTPNGYDKLIVELAQGYIDVTIVREMS